MDEPPRVLLSRNEFLFLVFTLLTAGVITQALASFFVYGIGGYGDTIYGGTVL
ncbi:hypothetical protein [Salinigranum salinum]|jgi:hypothetical protein|uniref:hypothetical protein n=1 Tax=Salinigranum salinum TaxID=1364937 RepID=UPI00186557DA|nr:hypothetical protein [Salinigranum salinum]